MEALILFVVIGGLLLCIWRVCERGYVRYQEQLLDSQARKRHGAVQKTFLSLTYPTCILTASGYELIIETDSFEYKRDPSITARASLTLHRPVRLELCSGSYGHALGRRYLQTGTAEFDAMFNSQGTDGHVFQGLFSPSIQAQLLHLHKQCTHCRILLTPKTFTFSITPVPADEHQYDLFFESVLACCHQLHECTRIRTVWFSTVPPNSLDLTQTLLNPDVSALSVPPLDMQHIRIDATSYPFHRLEQFLTYAVNHIGQDYLKKSVMVTVYGNIKRLHPNLQNSLTNICQQMIIHEMPG
jgi:hypothetical protein